MYNNAGVWEVLGLDASARHVPKFEAEFSEVRKLGVEG